MTVDDKNLEWMPEMFFVPSAKVFFESYNDAIESAQHYDDIVYGATDTLSSAIRSQNHVGDVLLSNKNIINHLDNIWTATLVYLPDEFNKKK